MISLFIGIVSFFIGLFFLVVKWQEFLAFFYGFFPISLVLAGIIAIVAGVSSIRDNIKAVKEEENLKND